MTTYYGLGSKEEIMANLDTALNEIPDINFVDYQRISFSGIQPDDYPGCFINDVRVDKTRLLKDIVKNSFGAAIPGWVWADDDENLITKLNAWVETIKDKIMEDPTRGSKAYDTLITSIETDGGSRHPQGLVMLILDIIFFSQE